MQPPSYSEIVSRVDRGGRMLATQYPKGIVPPEAYVRIAAECDLPLSAVTSKEIEAHPVSRALYVAGFCREALDVLQRSYDAVEAMFFVPQPVLH